jgi:hypothetical protein
MKTFLLALLLTIGACYPAGWSVAQQKNFRNDYLKGAVVALSFAFIVGLTAWTIEKESNGR